MKFAIPTTVLFALATSINAWSFGLTPFDRSRQLLFQDPLDLIEANRALINRAFGSDFAPALMNSGPHWEITNEDERLKIALDLPGVKAEDIDISVEDETRMIKIKGHRKVEKEGYMSSMEFSKAFTLDPTVDLEKFTASLSDGVLVITAPKDMQKIEEAVRKIPVLKSSDETSHEVKVETSVPNGEKETVTAEKH